MGQLRHSGFSLGVSSRWLRSFDPPIMRIDSDVRRCVVFIGHANREDDESFRAAGTGFFVAHDGVRYLATAQHIAVGFGDAPFCVRVNRKDGTSDNVFCDQDDDPDCRWMSHPDPDVDLAIMPWHFSEEATGMDMLAVGGHMLLTEQQTEELGVNVGDMCHAIGLFRLLQGSQRNVPVVHTGNIAMMPGEELIPVDDWLQPKRGKRRRVRGYLVEMQNLKGLSGAPVLVRPTVEAVANKLIKTESGQRSAGEQIAVAAQDVGTRVLGVWTASWDAPADEVASLEYGADNRVPVGLGTVVPAARLIELLSAPHVLAHREEMFERRRAEEAAKPDASPASAAS